MPWFNVDDGFADQPATVFLRQHKGGHRAAFLWLLAGTWSAKHLTDGEVPGSVVAILGYKTADADLLVEAGLWEQTKGGYRFIDWARGNRTKEQIEATRAKTKAKVANWRGNQVTKPVTGEGGNQVTAPPCNQVSNPAPIQSSPIQSNPKRGGASADLGSKSPRNGHRNGKSSPTPISDLIPKLPEKQPETVEFEAGFSAVWREVTGQSLDETEFEPMLAEVCDRADSEFATPLHVFRRAAKTFADDCAKRDKRPVFAWFRDQFSEWSAPTREPKPPRNPHINEAANKQMRRDLYGEE